MKPRVFPLSTALVEAGWLLVLGTLPLVINALGAGSADLAKTSVLRALVWAMLVAWLIGQVSRIDLPKLSGVRWNHGLRYGLRAPLAKVALLLGGVHLVATLFSIHPRISWWGTYQRAQGTYTFLSYLALFFLIHTYLQRPSQPRRLLSTVVLSSAPVAVYAIFQYYRLDPLLREAIPVLQGRVPSTLGNPIFLGDYLIMVIPITLFLWWSEALVRRSPSASSLVGVIAYGVLFVVQEWALLLTQSRGPFFSHLISLLFGAVLWAATYRKRRIAILTIGVGFMIAAFITVANVSQIDFVPSRLVSQHVRLVNISNLTERDAVWASAVSLLRSAPWRSVIGYGPESTPIALLPHLTPEAARYANAMGAHWDRAHNATFDALITIGVPGFIAYLLLFGLVFYVGLRELGLIATPRHKRAYVGLLSFGVVAGLFVPWAIGHSWLWLGVGVPAGMLIGVGVYAVISAITGVARRPKTGKDEHRHMVLALLVAITAYFAATQVGIPTTADLTLFWSYMALLSSVDTISSGIIQAGASGPEKSSKFVLQALNTKFHVKVGDLWQPLLVAVVLATLGFDFLWIPDTPFVGSGSGLFGVFVVTWLLGGWFFLLTGAGSLGMPAVAAQWIRYNVVVLSWFGLFCGMRAVGIFLLGHEFDFHVYMLWLFCSLILLGAVLQLQRGGAGSAITRGWLLGVYSIIFSVGVGIVWFMNAQPVQADTYAGSARAYASQGRWAESVLLYQKATAVQPMNDIYQFRLAEAYARYAETAGAAQQATWFRRALETAHRAWELNPGQMYHAANLAHVYLLWAQSTQVPDVRAMALQEAQALYEETSRVLWYDARLYREWGLALQLQGDATEALEKYRQSIALDPREAETYRLMGYLYEEVGKLDAAEQALLKAAKLEPRSPELHTALGEIYLQQERLEEALKEAQRAVELAPKDYRLYLNLAFVYRERGEIEKAITTIQRALSHAPPDRRVELQRLIDELETEKGRK